MSCRDCVQLYWHVALFRYVQLVCAVCWSHWMWIGLWQHGLGLPGTLSTIIIMNIITTVVTVTVVKVVTTEKSIINMLDNKNFKISMSQPKHEIELNQITWMCHTPIIPSPHLLELIFTDLLLFTSVEWQQFTSVNDCVHVGCTNTNLSGHRVFTFRDKNGMALYMFVHYLQPPPPQN